jgi:polygalacturonase
MPALPIDGAPGWGDTLNTYLTALSAEANTTQTTLNSHAANTPLDPHGDRAYASSLVNPIVNGVNAANGYVKLNSSGFVPASLVNASSAIGGMYNAVYDAVTMYGATPGTGSDQSAFIQNALNAASAAGGGIVYIGPGTFSMGNYIVIPSNTWLLMTPATILQRITASVNAPYLITNVKFGTSNTPATNIRITGGQLNSYGSQSVSSACTNIFLIGASNSVIEELYSYSPFNAGPAIEINGCSQTSIRNCIFDGVARSSGSSAVPAVRINTSSTSTTPAGLAGGVYNNASVYGCMITNCSTAKISLANGPFCAMTGSDLYNASFPNHYYVIAQGCMTAYASNQQAVYIPSAVNWNNSLYSANAWYEFSGVWNLITTDSSWSPLTNYAAPQYRITSDGNLQLAGAVQLSGNITSNNLNSVHPLPPLFRPGNNKYFRSADTSRSGAQLKPNGVIEAIASGYVGTFFEIEATVSML